MARRRRRALFAVALVACALPLGCGSVKHEPSHGLLRIRTLATDPHWQGFNNRGHNPCRTVVQDFGWHPGRIGGLITRATRPAFYGARVARDLSAPISVTGRLVVHGIQREPLPSGAALFGFFRHDISQWRAPDSLAMGVSTGGAHGGDYVLDVQYGTHNLRAGGAFIPRRRGSEEPYPFRFGRSYRWELVYLPVGTGGQITLRVGEAAAVLPLPIAARTDGARLDRFGMATQVNGAGVPIRLDVSDVVVDGARQDLRSDPGWDGRANRATYRDCQTGSRANDFGWTGAADRRIGGMLWRTDEHHPAQRAFYGDRTRPLTLENPLFAQGTLQLRRANTDSATLLGWFAASSTGAGRARSSPPNFLGLRIDGLTRAGLQVSPAAAPTDGRPRSAHTGIPITPGRRTLPFTLSYDPRAGPAGRVVLTLGKRRVSWNLARRLRRHGARFDRFGLRALERGGSWQEVFLGHLRYTVGPAPRG